MASLSKRSLTIFVLVALLPFLTGATIVIRGPRVAVAACSTLRDNSDGDESGSTELRYGDLIWAIKFTTAATPTSYTACRVSINVDRIGTSSDPVYVEIYSHNAGTDQPDAVVSGGTSTSKLLSELPESASPAYVDFTGLSASLSASTVYWVAFRKTTSDNTNYARLRVENSAGQRVSKNDGAWAYFADRLCSFAIYSD